MLKTSKSVVKAICHDRPKTRIVHLLFLLILLLLLQPTRAPTASTADDETIANSLRIVQGWSRLLFVERNSTVRREDDLMSLNG